MIKIKDMVTCTDNDISGWVWKRHRDFYSIPNELLKGDRDAWLEINNIKTIMLAEVWYTVVWGNFQGQHVYTLRPHSLIRRIDPGHQCDVVPSTGQGNGK